MQERPRKEESGEPTAPVEAVGDALRAAVERTIAATAGPASGTRERAQSLLDDVVRRGNSAREEVSRRGTAARDEVARRGEGATARLAEAIGELRAADREGIDELGRRLAVMERRLAAVEALIHAQPDPRPEGEETREDRLGH